jgi:uncharacterized membrane protein
MRAWLAPALLWSSAIGCGLMAGVYFAFSAFIMTSLGRIAPAAGVAAMNATNVDIVKSPFILAFLVTTLTAAGLAILGVTRRGQPGSALMVMGGVIYVAGMFIVTMAVNQPMNEALMGVDPASPQGVAYWSRYVTEWTMWNHVRTVASTVAMGMFIAALTAR